MYNVSDDETTLYFSSSSPITVQLVPGSAYYYNKYNQKVALKAAIQRAEEAELRCRRLEYEMEQLRNQPPQVIDIEDDGDREIDYLELDDPELDDREP